jgi:protocatechuate 3,4-dioxygenase beta subunit
LRAQTPAKPAVKTARSTISGRVTIKDKPAAGVTVGLRQTISGAPTQKMYKGVTDEEGFYRITSVPAGTYEITPAAFAYVAMDGNTARPKSVIVGDDENIEDINFSLVRGGVITGKVTDADGRPVVQLMVNLYRASDFVQQSMRQIYPAVNVQTDDRGVYRFFGLAAGRYKVASGRGDEVYVANYTPSRLTYKQVFHPDVTDHTRAPIIEVREGSEAANIDIRLGAPAQTFTVTGRVIDGEKGLPIPNIRFAVQRMLGDRFEMIDSMSVSNSRGDFIAEGLVPGKYGVVLFGDNNPEFRVEATWFDVVDSDVTGVTIKLTKGSTATGTIVLEPDDKKGFAKLLQFQLRAYVSAPTGMPAVGQTVWSPIAPDGTFRLSGLSPGRVNLWLAIPMANQPKGFAISRVEQNGVVVPNGLEIKEGDQLTGVRVVVSYGTATLRGTVQVQNGTLPDGARIFVHLSKPGTPPISVATLPVDARGHFLMEGLPAGVYEASLSARTGTRIAAMPRREVNVQDGVVNELTLTLDLAATPPRP